MDKKSKILVIILIILIIIIIGIIMLVTFFNGNKVNNNIDTKEDDIEQRIKTLYENSYKYYQIKEGKLDMGEATIEIDGVTYTAINDPLITSLEYIYDLIENSFSEKFSDVLYDDIFEKHKFIELKDTLYVNLSLDTCEIDYELKYENMTYEIEDDNKMSINLGSRSFYAYYENSEWKLRVPFHSCGNSMLEDEEIK